MAAHFMRGKIKKIESKKGNGQKITKLYTEDFGTLKDGDYVSLRLHSNIGETYFKDNQKELKIIKKLQKEKIVKNFSIDKTVKKIEKFYINAINV